MPATLRPFYLPSESERTVALANSSFCPDQEKRKWKGRGREGVERRVESTQLEYRSHQNPILRDRRGRKQVSLFASIPKDDKKRLFCDKRKDRFMTHAFMSVDLIFFSFAQTEPQNKMINKRISFSTEFGCWPG